jgi:hypothetical protein
VELENSVVCPLGKSTPMPAGAFVKTNLVRYPWLWGEADGAASLVGTAD